VDIDDIPPDSEQKLEEPELKKIKQELENNRFVKRNEILDTKLEITGKIIENFEAKHDTKTVKQLREDYDKLKKERYGLDSKDYKDVLDDMPIIPIGENTHEKNKSGFKISEVEDDKLRVGGKVKMSKALERELKASDTYEGRMTASTAKIESLRDAWNGLTDKQRDLVGQLNITKVKAKNLAGGLNLGSWNVDGTLTVNLDDRFRENSVDRMYAVIQHEVAHAEWHELKKSSPEKTNKFIETVMDNTPSGTTDNPIASMKQSPLNSYTKRFLQTNEMIDARWKTKEKEIQSRNRYIKKYKIDEMTDLNRPLSTTSDDEIEIIKKGFYESHEEWARTIYANETHSAISEVVHGVNTTKSDMMADNPHLKKFFNAYKELHDL